MREILFKAKRIDNGEWVEGCLITRKYAHTDEVYEAHIVEDAYEQLGVLGFGIHPVLISPLADKYVDGCFRVDINTICQYTGLTDKNGNKIWENDLLMFHSNKNDLAKASYGEFYVVNMENLEKIDSVIGWHYEVIETDAISKCEPFNISMPLTNDYIKTCELEVIGNIFDNPELLKGSEEE